MKVKNTIIIKDKKIVKNYYNFYLISYIKN